MPNQWKRAKIIDGKKQCNSCDKWKELALFHLNKSCVGGVTGTCRSCNRNRINKWYSDNRSRRQKAANNRNKERKLEWIARFGDKCHDCGGSFQPCVYDFHHLFGKDLNPSAALAGHPDKANEELKKCIMLCANCHRIRHFGEEDQDAAFS